MRFWLLILLPLASGCAGLSMQAPPTQARYLDLRAPDQSPSCDRYYVVIFSSQNALKQPRFTHTWATAVRAVNEPGQPARLEQHTISWMPATLDIKPLRPRLEPGVNIGLHETISRVALANRERIAMWGPYECRRSLHERFLVQKRFLESGRMGYQCLDSVGEAAATGAGCHCIHAVTDMDPEYGRRQYAPTRYGFAAGREIARRFRELNVLIDPERTHDFLIPALGLTGYPITRADADDILTPSRASLVGPR